MTNACRKSEDHETKPSDRRVNKPLIEKRRRERINSSLRELKLILEAVLSGQIPRDSKMEKADILELTVNHLRVSQRRQLYNAASYDPKIMDKYRVGFTECASEVSRFLTNVDGVNEELRSRILNHLNNHVATMGPQRNYACSPPQLHIGVAPSVMSPGLSCSFLENSEQEVSENFRLHSHYSQQSLFSSQEHMDNHQSLNIKSEVPSSYQMNSFVRKVPAIRPVRTNTNLTSIEGRSAFRDVKAESQLRGCEMGIHNMPLIPDNDNSNMWRPW